MKTFSVKASLDAETTITTTINILEKGSLLENSSRWPAFVLLLRSVRISTGKPEKRKEPRCNVPLLKVFLGI